MDQLVTQARESLHHVFWIGGAAAAGKSTIARRLCEEFDFTLLSGDQRWIKHWQTATLESNPVAYRIGHALQHGESFDWFFGRAGQEIADDYFRMARYEFQDNLEELLDTPKDRPIVVDAFLGYPELVLQVKDPRRAVFLVSTQDFTTRTWQARTTHGDPRLLAILRGQLDSCRDPADATQNFVDSNLIERRFIVDDCLRMKATLITTGGNLDLDQSYQAVKRHFGLA